VLLQSLRTTQRLAVDGSSWGFVVMGTGLVHQVAP
jgi:hypothetical protein